MKGFLNEFIHIDQNGFLPSQQLRDNLRVMLNVLEYYENYPGKQVALVFIDAQKAFDRFNWEFILLQLEHMGFGQRLLNAIKAIYFKQNARLLINGNLTEEFSIGKGTRQGCPLSPLLFILLLETLLHKIRNEEGIKGLKIRDQTYKTQAFADDMAFILEDPIKSCLSLLEKIEEFGAVAGLLINKKKTNILTKNMPEKGKQDLEEATGLKVVSKVKYLGIELTGRCSSIQGDNYIKLLTQVRKDLEKWGKIQLSLLGRVAQ